MTLDQATIALAQILRAENDALAAGDAQAAVQLVPQKQAAAQALQTALPGPWRNAALATELRDLVAENRQQLELAMDVQSRILEMVARAARQATAAPTRYGARGKAQTSLHAMALELRA